MMRKERDCKPPQEPRWRLKAKGDKAMRREVRGEDKKNELDTIQLIFYIPAFTLYTLHSTLSSKKLLHGYLILQYVTMLIL